MGTAHLDGAGLMRKGSTSLTFRTGTAPLIQSIWVGGDASRSLLKAGVARGGHVVLGTIIEQTDPRQPPY